MLFKWFPACSGSVMSVPSLCIIQWLPELSRSHPAGWNMQGLHSWPALPCKGMCRHHGLRIPVSHFKINTVFPGVGMPIIKMRWLWHLKHAKYFLSIIFYIVPISTSLKQSQHWCITTHPCPVNCPPSLSPQLTWHRWDGLIPAHSLQRVL